MATAPAEMPVSERFEDVTLPELWGEDRWREPFAALRADGGIHYFEDSHFGPYWAITTAKPIIEIESRADVFSSEGNLGGITLAGQGIQNLQSYEVPMPMFIAMDEPKHSEQRKTVAPSLGPSPVAEMRADAIARTGAVLDELPLGQTFDWVDKVSMELTTQMLARLFDFPWEDRRNLASWSDILGDIESFADEEKRKHRLGVAYEMGAAFHALWERKKTQPPGKDMTSAMLHSQTMSNMEEGEFIGNMILLIVGGNDTTRHSMSAYAHTMNMFPGERDKVENDPSIIANAVQEIVRWQTPLAHMRRTALSDYVLDGHQIRAGDKIGMWYASANRDESVFPDGETIKVDRENARRHLSFGYGIHRCVGARVAELQLQVLIEEMNKRRLRVHIEGEPDYNPSCFVHGYRHLPVSLERY